MKRQELEAYLDHLLNPSLFNDDGLNGLQVEGRETIHRLGVAVTASLSTIEKAISQGCDALLVHHGLFWKKQQLALRGPIKRRLEPIVKHDLSLFAYHLPLDAHPEIGNNWKVALDLRWSEVEPYGKHGNSYLGVQGKIKTASLTSVIKDLENYFGHSATLACFGKDKVEKIAFVSGGGWRFAEEAIEKDIDLFITGSFDEPVWSLCQEWHLNFAAFGHFASERVGPLALAEHLKKTFPIEILFIDDDNPF